MLNYSIIFQAVQWGKKDFIFKIVYTHAYRKTFHRTFYHMHDGIKKEGSCSPLLITAQDDIK